MTKKNELYNELLNKVQNKGGFVRIKTFDRPCVLLKGEKADKHVIVAALFASDDDSSPLKLITNRFTSWDVDDYLNELDIGNLLSRIERNFPT